MDNIEHRNLVLLLQRDPLSSYSDLSRKLSITAPTAKNWVNLLMGNNGGDKVILGVNGIINSNRIGLENHTFKIAINNFEEHSTFEMMDDLAEQHPYTLYKNYYFGGTSGVFLQLNIPKGTEQKLFSLFQQVKKISSIDTITRYSHSLADIDTYPEIDNFKNGRWDFNFYTWLSDISSNQDEFQVEKGESILNKLLLEDVIIAREIRMEARRKQVDIIKSVFHNHSGSYSKDEQNLFVSSRRRHLSRRFEFVSKNHIISNYQLRYNRERFLLFNQLLFTGKFKQNSVKDLLYSLKVNPPPFRSNFRLFDNNSFIWWIDLPPGQISAFTNFLYNICYSMELNILDSKRTRTYPLWHKNFVAGSDQNAWRASDRWMVDNPMASIMQKYDI